jgi:uncharacterized protein (TIGR02147 family)
MTSVFDYQNYRLFLSDFLNDKKQHEKGFSQRDILKKMEISSSGFLSNVLSGRNNLTLTQVAQLGKILKLKKADAAYFEALVLFTQAKTLDEKNIYYSRMVKLHKLKFKSLKKNQLSLFAKWYYAVIRELIYFYTFTGDYKELARMVDPPISPKEAEEAIHELEKIGLIRKESDGIYRQQSGIVTTGDEVRSFHVAKFIMETLKHAERALDMVPPNERDLSVLTLKLSEETMKQMKTEIQMFRKKLLRMAETDSNQNRVYQCNINFFPATKGEE